MSALSHLAVGQVVLVSSLLELTWVGRTSKQLPSGNQLGTACGCKSLTTSDNCESIIRHLCLQDIRAVQVTGDS